MQKIYVYGPRRSGTNAMEYMINQSYADVLVPNLNRDGRGYSEYHTKGSKHDLDRSMDEKFSVRCGSKYIIMLRNPVSWIYSRHLYEKICVQGNPNHVQKPLDEAFRTEWRDYYQTVLEYMNEESKVRNQILFMEFEKFLSIPNLCAKQMDMKWGIPEPENVITSKKYLLPNRGVSSTDFKKKEANPYDHGWQEVQDQVDGIDYLQIIRDSLKDTPALMETLYDPRSGSSSYKYIMDRIFAK